jgi:hypothetical protein
VSLIESEIEKAALTLPELAKLVQEKPTPFVARWFELCLLHGTMVYPVKPYKPGRLIVNRGDRIAYGKPPKLVECLESALAVGRRDIWFAKVIDKI